MVIKAPESYRFVRNLPLFYDTYLMTGHTEHKHDAHKL